MTLFATRWRFRCRDCERLGRSNGVHRRAWLVAAILAVVVAGLTACWGEVAPPPFTPTATDSTMGIPFEELEPVPPEELPDLLFDSVLWEMGWPATS